MNLSEALTQVAEIGGTQSKTKAQNQKRRRKTLRSIKRKTDDQWSKVDCDTMLGTRQAYKQRDLQRKSLHFESTHEASVRTLKRKALEEAGLRKKEKSFS